MPKRYKVLITGSSGMLGTDLSRELNKGYEVIGIDLVNDPQPKPHDFYRCDITDKSGIADITAKMKPDYVIHAAAWTDVDACESDAEKAFKINSEGAENVALACGKAGAGLVYISTDFVFDGKKKTPYKETDASGPLCVYAKSKLKGEERVKESVKEFYILRVGWLYGGNGKNFVDTVLSNAKTEKVIKVVDDQVGSPTYTKDLSGAIRALLDTASSKLKAGSSKDYGIYHVSNAGSVSWYEYAKTILKLAGCKADIEPISSEELARPARRPAMSVLNNSKFTALTGFRMRSWQAALKEYMALKKKEKVC